MTPHNSGAPLGKGRQPLCQLPVLPVAGHFVVHACHLQYHDCGNCGSLLPAMQQSAHRTACAWHVAATVQGLWQSGLISPTCGVCCPLGVSATRKGNRVRSDVAQLACEANGMTPHSGDCVHAAGVKASGFTASGAGACSRGVGVGVKARAPGCTRAVLALLVAEPGCCRGVGDSCAMAADLRPGVCLKLSGLGCCRLAAAAGVFSLSSAAAPAVSGAPCSSLYRCNGTLTQQLTSKGAVEVHGGMVQHICEIAEHTGVSMAQPVILPVPVAPLLQC